MNMLRRFHCPAAWPPAFMVILFVAIYGIFAGGMWLIGRGLPENAARNLAFSPESQSLLKFILAGEASVFAVFRLLRFHPVGNRAHASWLQLSPWAPDKPLPLGPVYPVWQDMAVVGILAVLARAHEIDPAVPVIAYGLAYLITMTVLLILTRTWKAVLALGFLWPALLPPGWSDGQKMMVLTGIVIFTWLGFRESMRSLPWPFLYEDKSFNKGVSGTSILNVRLVNVNHEFTLLGWPYFPLSPKYKRPSATRRCALWVGLLAGWWTYCMIQRMKFVPDPGMLLFFSGMAALLRWCVYIQGVTPQFNIGGRLFSGKLIIPGFDKVFVTPLALVILGILGGWGIKKSGCWGPVIESCAFGLISFVALAGGPSLRGWLLTAPLRFDYKPTKKDRTQRLQRV